jgi:redox-sensitive bicupin YhaK (pirin superfamily)
MLKGEVQHFDSWGNSGIIKAGGIQWMSSGSGLVHCEMPSDAFQETGGEMEGFQLWVNMAAKDKKNKPRYQDLTPEDSHKVTYHIKHKDENGQDTQEDDVSIRVVAGEVGNVRALIHTNTPIFYLDITFHSPGAQFTYKVPRDFNAFTYIYRGAGEFGANKTKGEEGQLLVLGDGDDFTITSSESANGQQDAPLKVLLIGGKPFGEPIARYGPFVMNTQDEIRQAFVDYQSGKFGHIPGAEERQRKIEAVIRKRNRGKEL